MINALWLMDKVCIWYESESTQTQWAYNKLQQVWSHAPLIWKGQRKANLWRTEQKKKVDFNDRKWDSCERRVTGFHPFWRSLRVRLLNEEQEANEQVLAHSCAHHLFLELYNTGCSVPHYEAKGFIWRCIFCIITILPSLWHKRSLFSASSAGMCFASICCDSGCFE